MFGTESAADQYQSSANDLGSLQQSILRLTQRTVKFIRWLKKPFALQALLGSRPGPSLQNLRSLMIPMLDTVEHGGARGNPSPYRDR